MYAEYAQAADILRQQGHEVSMVQVPAGRGKRWRLHVAEKQQ
jgi:hypothetical protein